MLNETQYCVLLCLPPERFWSQSGRHYFGQYLRSGIVWRRRFQSTLPSFRRQQLTQEYSQVQFYSPHLLNQVSLVSRVRAEQALRLSNNSTLSIETEAPLQRWTPQQGRPPIHEHTIKGQDDSH